MNYKQHIEAGQVHGTDTPEGVSHHFISDLLDQANNGVFIKDGRVYQAPGLKKALAAMVKDGIAQETALSRVMRSNDSIARLHEVESERVREYKKNRSKELAKYS